MMLLTQSIPNNISRVTYLLLGNMEINNLPKDVLKEHYSKYLTGSGRHLLRKAENSFESLQEFEKELLLEYFLTNDYLDVPKKDDIKEQILTIAGNKLGNETLRFIKMTRNGIPEVCLPFCNDLDITRLNNILVRQGPTPNKIIQVLSVSKTDLTSAEVAVLYYLKMFFKIFR